ncbi:putative quinol monooxygenase [Kitasatospora sp. NPDC048298]|uniref:putative quinol monooxygenase n=1 Tax=Kitasatospora sp. NPDC048298 TaxID=3364049 RepID=UPI003719C00D
MTIQIVVTFDLVPERLAPTLAAFQELARHTRREDGALRFDVFRSEAEEHTVVLVEDWADQEAIDLHMKEEYTRAFLAAVDGAFRAPARVHRLAEIGG